MKKIILIFLFVFAGSISSLQATEDILEESKKKGLYQVGIDDILQIKIFQPEEITISLTISPDGYFSFPYIGDILGKGRTLSEIQQTITKKLSHGYMKYPIVSVTLEASRSRKFYVFGEVINPGMYLLGESTNILKAISIAGGFTKYGSSSRIKLLRPNKKKAGYKNIKVDMKSLMQGDSEFDYILQPGDILVISEGFL